MRLGGCAALALGAAGAAVTGAGTAQAGVIPTRPAAVVWGSNSNLTPAQLANSTGAAQQRRYGLGLGADDAGQLGNAPTAGPVTRPVETTGMDSEITQISAGLNHVLALKSNGTVLAWGDNTQGAIHPALLVIYPA